MRVEEAERLVRVGRAVWDRGDLVFLYPQPLRRPDGSTPPGGHCDPGSCRVRWLDKAE